MKQLSSSFILALLLGNAAGTQAQVGINTPTPDNSAVLDLTSTGKGILIPRMSATDRAGISAPATGLMVYQHTAPEGFYYYSGTGWTYLNPAPAGDNLGSHSASQNLGLNGFWLSNDGESKGLKLDDNGNAGLNTPDLLTFGGYGAVGTLANKRGLTIASAPAYTANAPAVLELMGSADNVGEETGMIDFIIQASTNNNYNVARITAVRENSNPTHTGLAFYTRQFATLGEKMRITNTGRLGLGTAAPAVPFEVSGVNNQAIRVTSTNNSDVMLDLVIGGSTFNDYQIRNDNGILRLSSSTNDLSGTLFRVNMDEPGNWYPSGNGTQSLGLSTNRWLAVYATNGTIQTSDRRLKENIAPLRYGLDEVMKLQPVAYTWKSTGEKKVGLIAQDVQQLVPEVVTGKDAAGSYLGMNYAELVPVLIKALQEQQALIQAQQRSHAQLQQQVSGQAAQLEQISRALEKLDAGRPAAPGLVNR